MLTTKNYGDVLSMIPSAVKIADYGNFFEPLGSYDELSRKYNWLDDKVYNGQVYGIPAMGGVSGGLCYNKRIWAQAGITTLPKTPEEFIAGLQRIKDRVPDVIPFYTLYNFSWCITQWNGLVNSVSGNPNRERDMLVNKTPIFDPSGPYHKVYKLMYEIFSRPALHEPDPMTDDWEGSKPAINAGKIATMMMGSWAVAQFKQAGSNPQDIGYMPAPFAINGKQYAESSGDGPMCVNKNSSPEVRELAKKFVFWFVESSGFAQAEEGIPTIKGSALPGYLEAFKDAELFTTQVVPQGLVGVFDTIAKTSGISPTTDETGNFKFQIADTAFGGRPWSAVETLMTDWNKKWLDTLNANADLKAYKP
jgi:ABC-type glycerol-3-phosphate transport system substrate-binding protein